MVYTTGVYSSPSVKGWCSGQGACSLGKAGWWEGGGDEKTAAAEGGWRPSQGPSGVTAELMTPTRESNTFCVLIAWLLPVSLQQNHIFIAVVQCPHQLLQLLLVLCVYLWYTLHYIYLQSYPCGPAPAYLDPLQYLESPLTYSGLPHPGAVWNSKIGKEARKQFVHFRYNQNCNPSHYIASQYSTWRRVLWANH